MNILLSRSKISMFILILLIIAFIMTINKENFIWNQSTIGPDTNRRTFEIGGSGDY